MAMRTAEDVAYMESEIHDLRALVDDYKIKYAQADTERKMLKVENLILQKKCDERLERMTKVESMMTHLASGLHAGLKEMREERDIERAVRRHAQETQLAEETGPAPTFLRAGARTPDNSRVIAEPSTTPSLTYSDAAARSVESDQDRDDRLRGAAERLADRKPPPFKRPAIDHTLADNDSRMPGGPFVQKADDDNLREIAGDMQSKSG